MQVGLGHGDNEACLPGQNARAVRRDWGWTTTWGPWVSWSFLGLGQEPPTFFLALLLVSVLSFFPPLGFLFCGSLRGRKQRYKTLPLPSFL